MNSKNKQILYLGGFELPDKNAAAQRVIANAKILRELKYEVKLIGLTHDNSSLEAFKYEEFDCINLPYPQTILGWWKMLTSINQYLPFYTEDTSIVIAYNHPAIALKRLLKYNRKKGIKTLSDCTEWYEPQGGKVFKAIKGWDINQRMYKVHPQLDGIITISKYLYDFYNGSDVKTVLLPPLVDKSDKKWKHAEEQSEKSIELLFAGSVGRGNKDRVDFVIEALEEVVKKVDNILSLDIVGITEKQFRSVYEGWSERPIPKIVHFYGRQTHQKVLMRLQQSDFQIFVREQNIANTAGFPTKFVETISAGTLVLTNASSNLKDYMLEGVNSYELDISSKNALVESLMKPLSLTKEEILEKKRRIDSGMFDYRNYIEKMKRFLNSI